MNCPECDASLNIPNDASVGEIISCPDCGADFEISKKDGTFSIGCNFMVIQRIS